MINYIVAIDKNNGIGKDNKLPWKLSEDLKYFKEVTMGYPIVMGRKTYDSIGRPLPGRENIVVTRQKDLQIKGCTIINSPKEVLKMDKDMFVIGGAELFNQLSDVVGRLYITYIDEEFDCDTFFNWNVEEWKELIPETKGIKNEKNPYDYYFRVYERKS